jgi:hypothetical protein
VIAKKRIPAEIDEAPEPGVFNAEALLALIREFRESDEEDQAEQKRVLAELKRALDEERSGGRRLFPDQCS